MSHQDWISTAENEAILKAPSEHITFVQYEKLYTAALGNLSTTRMIELLRGKSLDVVKMKDVTVVPKMPREKKAVADFTEVSKTTLFRAKLEAERRFCGNDGETLTGAVVELTDREKIASILDLRTCTMAHLQENITLRDEAYGLYEEEYIRFGLQSAKWHKAKAKITDKVVVAKASRKSGNSAWDDSTSDDSDGESMAELNAAKAAAARKQLEKDKKDLKEEAKTCFRSWRKAAKKIDWRSEFPDLDIPKTGDIDPLKHLLKADMGQLMGKISKQEDKREEQGNPRKYGHLPKMAIASKGSIASLLASSFCERVNSVAQRLITKENTLLSSEEICILVKLRMNKEFLDFMRLRYGKLLKERFLSKYGEKPSFEQDDTVMTIAGLETI